MRSNPLSPAYRTQYAAVPRFSPGVAGTYSTLHGASRPPSSVLSAGDLVQSPPLGYAAPQFTPSGGFAAPLRQDRLDPFIYIQPMAAQNDR